MSINNFQFGCDTEDYIDAKFELDPDNPVLKSDKEIIRTSGDQPDYPNNSLEDCRISQQNQLSYPGNNPQQLQYCANNPQQLQC